MLITDTREIGNRLLAIRKKVGATQTELAEMAGLSNRTYADIERGSVTMRVDTLLHICAALHITPDEILTRESTDPALKQEEVIARLNECPPKERETALAMLTIYLRSIMER